MMSVGESLRRERLKRSLDLEQVSRELKISSKFLDAIEDERFDALPGGVFAKSFVRQYARYLGLDEDEMASEVQRTLNPTAVFTANASVPSQSPVEIHVPRVEEWAGPESRRSFSSSLPSLALVVVVMLVCSGVYSWWQRSRRQVSTHQESPAPITETAQAPATVAEAAPAQPAAEQPGVPASTGAESAGVPAATGEAPPAPEAAANRTPAGTTADVPAAASTPSPAPRTAPTGSIGQTAAQTLPAANRAAAVKLELTADEPVWVLARADGKYLFSGTIEPNQTRTVESAGTLTLRLGNAGGVNITLNGKQIGAVGPKGQVRTVQFTSGGFKIVAAPKPSPDDILL